MDRYLTENKLNNVARTEPCTPSKSLEKKTAYNPLGDHP